MLPSLAFLRHAPSRRLLHLILCICVIVFGYVLVKGARYTLGFYSSGTFVTYHMEMTPAVIGQDAPVKSIPVQELGYTAVYLYLITFTHLRELMLSLHYLYTNLRSSQPWPILLFYASSSPLDSSSAQAELVLRIYDYLGGGQDVRWFLDRIEFVEVELKLPEGISQNKVDVDPVYIHAWPGYHLQAGFFATKVFDHPRLRDVTYYLRLSPDSYIYEPLCYDPFEVLRARNGSYGFRNRESEPAWLTRGMYATLDSFARSHRPVEMRLEKNGWTWPGGRVERKMKHESISTYDTSFEVVRLDAFRNADMREWFMEIESVPERIYKYRWSDAAIRYATVSMYLDVERDVEEFCGVAFWHDGPHGERCPCEEQKKGRGR